MKNKLNFLKFFGLIVPMTLGSCSLFDFINNKNDGPEVVEDNTENTSEPEKTLSERLKNVLAGAVSCGNFTINESIPAEATEDNKRVSETYHIDKNHVQLWNKEIYSFGEEVTIRYFTHTTDETGTELAWYKEIVEIDNPITRLTNLLASFVTFEEFPNDGVLRLTNTKGEQWWGSLYPNDSGCQISKSVSTPGSSNVQITYQLYKIGTTEVVIPEAEWYVERTREVIWEEAISTILETQSFKYVYFEVPYLEETVLVDHNNTKIGNDIYTTENDKTYKFELNEGIWTRYELDEANPSEAIYNWLNGLLLTGDSVKFDGITFLMCYDKVNKLECCTDVDLDPIIFHALYLDQNESYSIERRIEKIGEVTVTIPENFVEADL